MKVIEHLEKADRPLISFEIIPPLRGGDAKALLKLIEDLMPHRPPFIDVTSHAAEAAYEETPDGGFRRRVKRKRPGTLGICALIQNKYNVDAVPHILCHGFTREETEDFLIELSYLGIDNVLAIRGDENGFKKPPQAGKTVHPHASDLVAQIADMNRGKYLEEDLLDAVPSDFCIGVAGYPEKHFEAPNLKADIAFARKKIEAGAHYIVTQMFFDNAKYFAYVEECRNQGIDVPIVPGLKILTTKGQLTTVPKHFKVDLPEELADEVLSVDPKHISDVGVNWAQRQVEELLEKNVPAVHFYVMQSSRSILRLLDRLDI